MGLDKIFRKQAVAVDTSPVTEQPESAAQEQSKPAEKDRVEQIRDTEEIAKNFISACTDRFQRGIGPASSFYPEWRDFGLMVGRLDAEAQERLGTAVVINGMGNWNAVKYATENLPEKARVFREKVLSMGAQSEAEAAKRYNSARD